MSTLATMIQNGYLAAAVGGGLYTATVITAALTALLARTHARRLDALEVLKVLLRRHDRQP